MEELKETLPNLSIPPIDFDPHILIAPTRKYYFDYICKLLSQNYISWCGEFPPHAVVGATRELELQAAAKAMVVPLYRKAILETIELIKHHTESNNLYPSLENFCIANKTCDKSSQTVDFDTISSTEQNYIKNVVNKSISNDVKFSSTETKNIHYDLNNVLLNATKEQTDNLEDKVLKDMEELFQTSDSENIEDDIFSDVTNDRQIMLIMEEINQFGKKEIIKASPKTTITNNTELNGSNINFNGINKGLSFQTNSDVNKQSDELSNNATMKIPKKYMYSRWPCELYYRKKILREKLDDICEKSFIFHSKLKERFIDLFGPQSEDEQGLQSPDTSIEFIRSCRQRVAPYVSRHMKPYCLRGHVPAHLLRPLAKHLIYQLIQINQYPDDYEVYLYIKQYFKNHKRIKCQADF